MFLKNRYELPKLAQLGGNGPIWSPCCQCTFGECFKNYKILELNQNDGFKSYFWLKKINNFKIYKKKSFWHSPFKRMSQKIKILKPNPINDFKISFLIWRIDLELYKKIFIFFGILHLQNVTESWKFWDKIQYCKN